VPQPPFISRSFGGGQIPRLENWLKRKRHLEVRKIKYSAHMMDGIHLYTETLAADEQAEYHPTWQMEKVYVCPRGIWVHRGNPTAYEGNVETPKATRTGHMRTSRS
jgi:hypothetical protein